MARWMSIILALVFLAAGCTGGSQSLLAKEAPGTAFPMTITDDAKREITIEKEPQRIVSLASSNTELVYALGLQDKLVGVDQYSDYPAEAKAKEQIGGMTNPSMEKIVALAPDLLLATNIHVKTVLPELEKRGLKVIVFQPATIDAVLANLQLLAKVSGRPGVGDKVVRDLRGRIDAVTNTTANVGSRPRVFFELSPDLITAGPGTFIDDLIAKAGGENIGRDAQTPWPKLNPESIVLRDPELIILSDHGSNAGGVTVQMVKERPGWSVISGVKSGRIIPLDDRDIVNRPGPRAVDGLEFLARTIHPELFK